MTADPGAIRFREVRLGPTEPRLEWKRKRPAAAIAPGETFETFRTFELVFDSTDRERKGLSLRRMYRTVAPWVTENPVIATGLDLLEHDGSNPGDLCASRDHPGHKASKIPSGRNGIGHILFM